MRGTVQLNLRIQPELLERLRRAADENRRTLGAEISLRLEQSFEPNEPAAVLREIAAASKVLAEAGQRLGMGALVPDTQTILRTLQEDEKRRERDLGPNPYPEADRPRTKKERAKS